MNVEHILQAVRVACSAWSDIRDSYGNIDESKCNEAHEAEAKLTNAINELALKTAEFKQALIDVLDGVKDHDLQSQTGLPETDCQRIAALRAER